MRSTTPAGISGPVVTDTARSSFAQESVAASDLPLPSVETAIAQLRAGRIVILVDDRDPTSEGDLVIAAQHCDPAAIAFLRQHGSGVIKVPMAPERIAQLGLPPMIDGEEAQGTAFAVSVDAKDGVTNGISAADRAHTIRLLSDPATRRADLTAPGHVFPIRAREGGVLVRAGRAEAAVDLCRLAGREPVAALCEAVGTDGSVARLRELLVLAHEHELTIVSVRDLIEYRMTGERLVERASSGQLATRFGTFAVTGYRVHGTDNDPVSVALTLGDLTAEPPILVRVQTACFAADVFGSLTCDCRARREAALRQIALEGRGVLVYMRQASEVLGACQVQLRRGQTTEAEQRLGLRASQREYGVGAQILRDLGVRRLRLLTNHRHRLASLYGLEVVDHVPLEVIDLGVPPPPASAVGNDQYRELAGSFPTGVTIVTTRDPSDGNPRGLTSQTFVGLSTEPPLIMISVAKTSRTLPSLLRSRAFVVNFLRADAEALSTLFASKAEDKFKGLEWAESAAARGAPILRSASVAYAECIVVEVHEAGDHWIFVGRVDGGEMWGGAPLMYYRRQYAPWPDA